MNRSLLLDWLRIVAISLVLVAHIGQLLGADTGNFFGIKNFYYVSLGGLGVSMFLVLSGVLAGLVDGPRHTAYPVYIARKLLRIYPMYWLSIPLAIGGYLLSGWLIKGWLPDPFPSGTVSDITLSLSGFYAWTGNWGGPYNSPTWFISLIITMYFLFPVIYRFMARRPHSVLVILLLVSVGARYYIGQKGVPFVDTSVLDNIKGWFYRLYGFMPGRPGDWFPPCRVFEFGLGVYLARILPRTAWFSPPLEFRPIATLSDLAFPLFLVHYPFLFLVPYLNNIGMPTWISIVSYLCSMLLIAQFLHHLDARLPRDRLMKFFNTRKANRHQDTVRTR